MASSFMDSPDNLIILSEFIYWIFFLGFTSVSKQFCRQFLVFIDHKNQKNLSLIIIVLVIMRSYYYLNYEIFNIFPLIQLIDNQTGCLIHVIINSHNVILNSSVTNLKIKIRNFI